MHFFLICTGVFLVFLSVFLIFFFKVSPPPFLPSQFGQLQQSNHEGGTTFFFAIRFESPPNWKRSQPIFPLTRPKHAILPSQVIAQTCHPAFALGGLFSLQILSFGVVKGPWTTNPRPLTMADRSCDHLKVPGAPIRPKLCCDNLPRGPGGD